MKEGRGRVAPESIAGRAYALLPRWGKVSIVGVALSAIALGAIGGIDRVRATSNTSSWQGAHFPVEQFQAYTSGFGYRRSGSGSEFHSGLDIAAPQGSYIRNWWAGEIVEVINDSRCGVGLIVKSGEWEHIYCHMNGRVVTKNKQKYLVDRDGNIQMWEGKTVEAGERIGRVGMTGRTTGPHLHWGMRYGGEWVDPATVIRAMYADGHKRKVQ